MMLTVADLHVASNPRDAYRWNFIERTLPKLIRAHRPAYLAILGDLTDAKDGHSAELVNRLADAIAALAKSARVICLRGNHDHLSDAAFFQFLHHQRNVEWINEPTRMKLSIGECLFLPHARDPEQTWCDVDMGDASWIFCHQAFAGAVSESGVRLAGTPTSIFPRGSRVISGDIHAPQRVGCVEYTGAPYLVRFGDAYEPRVLLLDAEKMTSIPVPGPQKRLLTVRAPSELTRQRMRALYRPGDVVKVRVDLPEGSDLTRTQVRADVRSWAESAGVALYAIEVVAPQPEQADRSRKDRTRSDEELVRAYVRKTGRGQATLSTGLKIMKVG